MKKIITIFLMIFLSVYAISCKSTEKVRGNVNLDGSTFQAEPTATVKVEPTKDVKAEPVYQPIVPVVKEEPVAVREEPVVVKEETVVIREEPVNPVYSQNTLVLPNGVTVRMTERGKVLVMNPKVLFQMTEPELPSDFKYVVPVIIKILDDNPSVKIVLEGHTSNKGIAYPYNYNLSVQRVDNAYKVFMVSGISPSKIIKSPLGEALPEFTDQKDLRRFEYVVIEDAADLDKYNNFVKTLDIKKESDKQ